jgi:AcrR family transcriptional regulator
LPVSTKGDAPSRRASSNAAGAATRERLLSAAERLVARSGVDGVSTREILVTARADSAAIHYHFGSKDALMEAVYRRRLHLFQDGAQRVLEAKAAQSGALSPRDLAEAIVRPVAELAHDKDGGRAYLGFIVAVLNYAPLAHLRFEGEAWMDMLIKAYGQIAPELDDVDRRRRIGFSSYVAIGAMADGPSHAWFQDKQMKTPGAMVDALLEFIASGLTTGG